MQVAIPSSVQNNSLKAKLQDLNREEVVLQMEKLLASRHFCNSRRYPALLRFVVEETIAGHAEELKERTLGITVFGRSADYDTNSDPVVRVTAGEVRKRLAQYYQEHGHERELRIDLPLGSYAAHFERLHNPDSTTFADGTVLAAATSPQPDVLVSLGEPFAGAKSKIAQSKWRSTVIRLSVLTAVLVPSALYLAYRLKPASYSAAIAPLWQPLIHSPAPVLVALGVHTIDSHGKDLPATIGQERNNKQPDMLAAMVRTDVVPIDDVVALTSLTSLLTRAGQPFRIVRANSVTLSDVRNAPVLLVGGLNNAWTLKLLAPLRYHFFASDSSSSMIVDSTDPSRQWRFNNLQPVTGASKDYGIVASYRDATIGQPVVLVAGIGMAGTLACAEFATHPEMWPKSTKPGDTLEFILQTDVLNGEPGPPRVIASDSR